MGGWDCGNTGAGAKPEDRRIAEEVTRSSSSAYRTVTFGRYPQSGGTPEPIEWFVLEADEANRRALLISRYGLDAKPYHDEAYTDITWEHCTLRKWLNGTFLEQAFTPEERAFVRTVSVDNGPDQCNGDWKHTTGGGDTQDRVFLLSYAEAGRYFDKAHRACAPTDHAIENGAYTDEDDRADGRAAGEWWLRSPGSMQNHDTVVDSDGCCRMDWVNSTSGVARPAFWLDLESGIL